MAEDPDLPRNAALAAFVDHITTLIRIEAESYAETMGGLPQVQIICIAGEDMEFASIDINPGVMADICAEWLTDGMIDLDDFNLGDDDDSDDNSFVPSRAERMS